MLWIQKMNSKGWARSLGYITPEICREQSACASLSQSAVGHAKRCPTRDVSQMSKKVTVPCRVAPGPPYPCCHKQKLGSN